MSLKANINQTVEPEEQPLTELEPALREELLLELTVYKDLRAQAAELAGMIDQSKAMIEEIRERSGEHSIRLPDFTVTRVDGGTTKKLDVKKLLKLGVTVGQIAQATTEKPKKPHTLITVRGEKQGGDDDEA